MKREHEEEDVQKYLLYVKDTISDKSDFKRPITNNGAVATDGFIYVSDSQTFNVPYSDDICKWNVDGFTIEMDCNCAQYLNGKKYFGTFVVQGNTPGDQNYWSFGIVKQRLSFYYWTGVENTVTGNSVIPLNEWHNIRMTFKEGRVSIYLDDVLEAQKNTSGTPLFSNKYNLVFLGHTGTTSSVKLKNIKIYKEE